MTQTPTDHSADQRRIARNTMFLYARMGLSMIVSLYTSRVILRALGVEDFGIYSVVGGLVAMFSLISGSLTAAIQRYLSYELGTGDPTRLHRAFFSSVVIQLAIGTTIVILGETVGLWALNKFLTIPPDRLYAANWVFQASLFGFLLSLMSVPYSASLIARERMGTFAYIGILETILRLAIVLFIAYSGLHFDRLIVYAILGMVQTLTIQMIYMTYCGRNLPECRLRGARFEPRYIREMGSFAGWNFIGSASALLRDQGGNILLNIFFGPALNATRGIASSVSTAVSAFATNFTAAMNPQITKSYAAGNSDYMMILLFRGSRMAYFLVLILALPIVLHTTAILGLWLGSLPPYAPIFVRLIIVFCMLEVISQPLITAQLATGNIRNYQFVVGGIQMLNLPLAYVLLDVGQSPASIFVVAILLGVLCLTARLLFLRGMIGLPVGNYVRRVLWPITVVTAVAALPAWTVSRFVDHSRLMLALSVAFTLSASSLSIYFIGLTKGERLYIKEILLKFRKLLIRR